MSYSDLLFSVHPLSSPAHDLLAPFKGAAIRQPSFILVGKADGLNEVGRPTVGDLRVGLPGLIGLAELDGIGHWPQHEAPDAVNETLLGFLSEFGRSGGASPRPPASPG